MEDFFRESLFAGVTLSLVAYLLGSLLKKKFKLVKFLIVLLMLYIVGFFIYKLFVAKINNIYISKVNSGFLILV